MLQQATNDFKSVLQVAIDAGVMDNATVTIKRHDGTTDLDGRPTTADPDAWAIVSGLEDLAAMVANDILMTNVSRSKEVRAATSVSESVKVHILLNDYYPQIRQEDRCEYTRGTEDTIAGNITGVESDSQSVMTRLEVELVTF